MLLTMCNIAHLTLHLQNGIDHQSSCAFAHCSHPHNVTAASAKHGTMHANQQQAYVCCRGVLKAFFIQLAIVSNHQNGRDSHLRQVKVYGPVQQSSKLLGYQGGFSTVEFSMYSTVR